MERMVLQYTHAAPGVPLLVACGLSLVKRAVITLGKAGVPHVEIALHPQDEAAVRAELNDRRVAVAWSVRTEGLGEGTVLPGDRVFLKSALETPTSDNWRPVTGPADLPAAEDLLIKSLTKPADGFIARSINRKISGPISRRLAPYRVHPNHVTAVVCLIGVLSGPFNAMGTWAGFVLGGLCYYVSSVLDGVDGELSRLKFLGSPLGAWLDTLVDDIVGTSYMVGLYLGLYRSQSTHWGWIGVVAVSFYFLTILPRYWLMVTRIGVGDHQAIAARRTAGEKGPLGRAADWLANTIFRLDFLVFLAFMVSLIGAPWFYAGLFAVGSVLSVGETVYTVAQLRRK